jgi:hypothetical protein
VEDLGPLQLLREENMFDPMKLDDAEYQLKPMNCPFHILMYQTSCAATAICPCPREISHRISL